MRFRLPFDDVQYHAAAKHHTAMRSYVHGLRKAHPPASSVERELLKQLRELVQDFGGELLKPRDRIDPVRLNGLTAAMIRISVEYIAAHQKPRTR
jgi:hypothetical protein